VQHKKDKEKKKEKQVGPGKMKLDEDRTSEVERGAMKWLEKTPKKAEDESVKEKSRNDKLQQVGGMAGQQEAKSKGKGNEKQKGGQK